ncbi:LuxR C-terminal-related transcriptional regulator [Streptomyces sp. SM14]|uniref:helix-turn-helix transcriptional regulator n=1 Tax=Streptomyces sp. SM14 TaxID=1736045 RepID=UPI0015E18F35|nr:LuxR C-terminal-related transcriptional regulator [Streptomyces sp. SM14]
MHPNEMAVLGLSAEEELIYRHFLREPGTDPDTLAQRLSLDGPAAAEAVERLRLIGLLRAGAAAGQVTPADPETAVARLTELRLRSLYREIQRITQSRHILDMLRAETGVPLPTPRGIEQLNDWPEVRTRIDDLAFFAREEILSVEPRVEIPSEQLSHTRQLNLRSLRRGVRLRHVVVRGALDRPCTVEYLGELVSHGARVRVADEISEHILVYDRHAALVPIDPWNTGRGALLAHSSGLVNNLVTLFEKIWDQAESISVLLQKPELDDGVLPEASRRVLTLMCTAGKDESAARDLGVSVRTYRRHVADVMQRLGAASRAQAALLARERGWI